MMDVWPLSFDKETLLDDLYLRLSHVQDGLYPGYSVNDPCEYLWHNYEHSPTMLPI